MKWFRKTDERAELMDGMSNRVGVNWSEELVEHPENAGAYRNAIRTCCQCQSEGDCREWQAQNPQADAAPEYCLNRDKLGAMAR